MSTSDVIPTGDILIVDDTPANLRLLSNMLSEQGYKVRPAPNGKLALMGVRAAIPDLILLDITMPEMDGYAVCAQLKADPQTRDIPIIFISALDQTEDKIKAFQLGGVDYITKPFHMEEVLARVKTHLTLHSLQRELVNANQELRATVQELERSNSDLDAFAHTVAHDLKNPLSIIIGFSTLLESRLERMETEIINDNLHQITRTGYKMSNIINELLLLASVRQMEMIQIGSLNMGAIVKEALGRLAPQIKETQAQISLPESWPEVNGYAAWVEEVWTNYLSNALKYGGTPPHITVGYQRVEPAGISESIPDGSFRFWVRDNGAGLTPEAQSKIFKSFARLEQTRASGHGLGLSIVLRIVEKLGGVVGVESTGEVGEGCTFWFTLPKVG